MHFNPLKNMFQKKQLYRTLLLLITIFSMVIMLAVSLMYMRRTRKDVYDEYRKFGSSSLNAVMDHINTVFWTMQDLSKQMMQDGNVNRFLNNSFDYRSDSDIYVKNKADQILLSNRMIDSVYISALDRDIVYSTNYGKTTFSNMPDLSFMTWYQDSTKVIEMIKTHKITVQKYNHQTKDVISVYTRLPLDNYRFSNGMLVINIEEDTVYDMIIDPILSESSASLYVLDENDQVIIARNKQELFRNYYDLVTSAGLFQGESGEMSALIDGVDHLVIYKTDPESGWRYVYAAPLTQVHQIFSDQTKYMILVCLAVLGVTLIASSVVSRYATRTADNMINLVHENVASHDGIHLSELTEALSGHFKNNEDMKTQLSDARESLKSMHIVNMLLSSANDTDITIQGLQKYEINIPQEGLMLAILSSIKKIGKTAVDSDLSSIVLPPFVEEFLGMYDIRSVCVASGLSEITVIFDGSIIKPVEMALILSSLIEQLQSENQMDDLAAVLYDKPFDLSYVHNAYSQARICMEFGLRPDSGEVVLFSDTNSEGYNDYHYDYNTERQLCNCIMAGNLEESIKALDKMITSFSSSTSLELANILLFNVSFYNRLMRNAYEQNLPVSFISDYSSKASEIQRISTMSESRAFFVEMITQMVSLLDSSRRNKIETYYDKIYRYIEENYTHSDMSLEQASMDLNISVSYINQILKGQNNNTFNQMLTEKRIFCAAALLKDSDLKIQDISTAVGYSSPNYFTRAFRTQMGVTPGKYREISRSQ